MKIIPFLKLISLSLLLLYFNSTCLGSLRTTYCMFVCVDPLCPHSFVQLWSMNNCFVVEEANLAAQGPYDKTIHYVKRELERSLQAGLITRHNCLTSLMLLWLNGRKSLQPKPKISWKDFLKVEAVIAVY